MGKIKVVELFAGVGGFRIGLEGWQGKSALSGYKEKIGSNYEIVWSNQWEPSTKTQHANLVYKNRWPNSNHNGKDIEKVIESNFNSIPNHDLLVGGFPCQDYSVATTLKNSKGLIGKKGVLWWSIYSILKKKGGNKPKYLILENVNRLLISPAKQRGRDFAVMLSCLNELGYAVEWRIINAADYGMPQRRRRVFILGYHKTSKIYKSIENCKAKNWLYSSGLLAKEFPIKEENILLEEHNISKSPEIITETFNRFGKYRYFSNTGLMINGKFYSCKTSPNYVGDRCLLRDIIHPFEKIPRSFIIDPKKKLSNKIIKYQENRDDIVIEKEIEMWKYLKGAKKEKRHNKKSDYVYHYSEGAMSFPDSLDKPSRTIITGEGGKSPSRFKHVILQNGNYRRLAPIELERLNMFPDDFTKYEEITDAKRAFFMGNALVIGIVEKIGIGLSKMLSQHQKVS